MREKPRDIGRLEHILIAIDNVIEFRQGLTFEEFQSNKIVFFAIVKNIEIIGEAVYMLSKEFKEAHPELPWIDIANMRHVLVHDYYQITPSRVWDTATNDVVELRPYIENYIAELAGNDTCE